MGVIFCDKKNKKEYKMSYPLAPEALEAYYGCLEIYKNDYVLAKEISKRNQISFRRAYYAIHEGRWKHQNNVSIIKTMKSLYA